MLYLRHQNGGLAHLARALAWQARGGRFESDILHNINPLNSVGLLFKFYLYFGLIFGRILKWNNKYFLSLCTTPTSFILQHLINIMLVLAKTLKNVSKT